MTTATKKKATAKAAAETPKKAPYLGYRLSPQPARSIATFDVPGVGRIRLSLTPAAFRAARAALDRGAIVPAIRAALAVAPGEPF